MQRCLLAMVWLRVNSIATLAAMGCPENLRDQRFRVRDQARYMTIVNQTERLTICDAIEELRTFGDGAVGTSGSWGVDPSKAPGWTFRKIQLKYRVTFFRPAFSPQPQACLCCPSTCSSPRSIPVVSAGIRGLLARAPMHRSSVPKSQRKYGRLTLHS